MRLPALLAIFLLCAIAAAADQSSNTTPTPDSGVTIRTQVEEVVLDVVARDSRGRIVKNLQAGDVQVLEDGIPQQIKSFRFVPGREVVHGEAAASTNRIPSAAAGQATKQLRAMNLICIVFHNLDTYDPNVRKYVADAVREFVTKYVEPNTWVGIFNLAGSDLTALHPFTTDRQAILQDAAHPFTGINVDFASASLDVLSASPNSQTLETSVNGIMGKGGTVTAGLRTSGGELSTHAITGADVATGASANAQRGAEFSQQRQFSQIEGQRQTDQILAMISRLQTLPGRKSVLLLSSGLANTGDPDLFKSVVDKANRGGITFYALDVNGLSENSNALASENVLSHAANISAIQGRRDTGNGSGDTNMEKMRQDEYVTQAVRTSDTQATLRALSEQTGGFLIGSTNDFRKPFERLLEEVDTHYELVYRPTSEKYDGHLRNIELKPLRAGLTLESRTGYYALPASAGGTDLRPWEMTALAALNLKTPPRVFPFQSAAWHFRSKAGAGSDCRLEFSIPVGALAAGGEPQTKRHRIDVAALALVKDAGGQVVEKYSTDSPYDIPDDRLDEVRRTDLMLNHSVSLAPGHYTIESVVLDRMDNRASTDKVDLVVPEQKGVGVSSIVPVQRLEAVKGAVDPSNPLEFQAKADQGARVVPELSATVPPDKKMYVYFVVYPDKSMPDKPKLQVQFVVAGQVVATQNSDLPQGDASGAIPMLINSPANPGEDELRITAIQGAAQATQTLAYTVPTK